MFLTQEFFFLLWISNPSRIHKWYIWKKKNPFFFTSTFRCFFFVNWFIIDYEILPPCNSLLICKCEEKPNIRITNKNIKYLMQLQLWPCYFIDLVVTKLRNGQNIAWLLDFVENQCANNVWKKQYWTHHYLI
jgi:hypothetical protein